MGQNEGAVRKTRLQATTSSAFWGTEPVWLHISKSHGIFKPHVFFLVSDSTVPAQNRSKLVRFACSQHPNKEKIEIVKGHLPCRGFIVMHEMHRLPGVGT
jgi:hypothetical protein